MDARIQRALDRVRPYLGSHAGGVQYLGVTDGVARLRLEGSCHGCPSSTVTVQLAISTAIEDAAPEVSDVAVEGMTAAPEPGLLQIGRRPPDPAAPDSAPPAESGAAWVTLPSIGPPSSRPVSATADGTADPGLRRPRHPLRLPGRLRHLRLQPGRRAPLNREELDLPGLLHDL